MSDRTRVIRRGADLWYRRSPDKAARVFHNILLRECPELRSVLELFPTPPPAGRGVYNHHDGYRT